ncbi:MAG: radical SAM protein [Candidatus Altiarchaeota archaeon]
MNVLLLNLPYQDKYMIEGRCQQKASTYSDSLLPPITLAYIASLLDGKADVSVIDCIAESMNLEGLKNEILNLKPDYLIANVTTPTIEFDLDSLSEIKGVFPRVKTAVMGIHATYFAEELAAHPAIDYVIRGEPDLTAYELPLKDPHEVKGLVFKEGGRIIETEKRPYLDVGELPHPAWDKLKLSAYRLPIKNKKYVIVMPGRGCPYNCSFCVAPYYYGQKMRTRSADSVIGEVEHVREKYGIDEFFFFVETFTLNKGFIIELCDKLVERKIKISWMCNSRVDKLDQEMLQKMKASGCWLMSFGIESANQGILDRAGKGITPEKSRQTIRLANRLGIATLGHFVLGLPGETEETIKKTIEFSKTLELDFAEYYIAVPYPGSRLYEEYKGAINASWAQFDYTKNILPSNLDLECYKKKAYKNFYLRPVHMLKVIKKLGLRKSAPNMLQGMNFLKSW